MPATPPADEGAAIVASSLEVVREWKLDGSNLFPALGCLVTDGKPVEGARIMVNNYLVPQATDENGRLLLPARHHTSSARHRPRRRRLGGTDRRIRGLG